jgi:DNA-3-methyladenine glycosylase II
VKRATAALAAIDPVMARLIERFGPSRLARPRREGGPLRTGSGTDSEGHLASLIESILYQQLAGRAAAAIHGRFITAVGGRVTAKAVLAAGPEPLRAAGLSAAKTRAVLELSAAAEDGRVDLDRLSSLPDDDIQAVLVALPGIGPWTAQMFCIFRLGRLDIWPVTDLGVRRGWSIAYGLDELPKPAELRELGEPMRPWRSVAAWYCWRAAEAGGG